MMSDIADFSTPKRNIQFKIDDDVFDVVSDIPAIVAFEFAELADQLDQTDAGLTEHIELMDRLLSIVLTDKSAKRFMARLRSSKDPITAEQFFKVLNYTMEELALRPTGPSEDSLDGSESPESGTPSTENAPSEESTPDSSDSKGS